MLEFLKDYMVLVIVGVCLCLGYILKKWIKDVDDKYIPTILAVVGLVMSAWINGWTVSPEVILQGMVSGLGSTGLHQAFKQIIEKKED